MRPLANVTGASPIEAIVCSRHVVQDAVHLDPQSEQVVPQGCEQVIGSRR